MKVLHLTGPKKYLVAAVLFDVVGTIFFIPLVLSGSLLALFVFAFFPVSAFLFYFWSLAKKGHVLPEKNNVLYGSFLIAWIGMSFFVIGLKINDIMAILLGGLMFVLTAPVFVIELVRIIKTAKEQPTEKLQKILKSYINIIVGIFVLVAISPIIGIAIYSLIEGQVMLGVVILAILAFLVWLFIKVKNKRK